jgi:hypothetical protein
MPVVRRQRGESQVDKTIDKNIFITLLLLSFCLLLGCNSTSFQKSYAEQISLPQPDTHPTVNTITPHDPVTDGWMEGATASAWQAFTQDGRYRWAGQNDFRFPEWAKQRYGPDLERAIRSPIQAGHIKGSYESNEVALIVVDITRQDWNRYGIVVFSEDKKNPERCEVKWIYQDRDLSRVKLGWSSGDTLGISEYGENGTYSNCFVKWDAKEQRYNCNLRHFR